MDGLARSVGDGISGVFGGSLSAISAALAGAVDSVSRTVPQGSLPVIAAVGGVLLLWLVLKR